MKEQEKEERQTDRQRERKKDRKRKKERKKERKEEKQHGRVDRQAQAQIHTSTEVLRKYGMWIIAFFSSRSCLKVVLPHQKS